MRRAAAWALAAGFLVALTAERGGVSIQRTGGGGGGGGQISGGVGRGAGGGGGAAGHMPGSSPGVVIHMQRYSVPAPQRIDNPDHVVRDQRHIQWPRQDDRGRPIEQQPAINPPARQHTQIMRNPDIVRDIHRDQSRERERDHYYWHDVDGVRYAHYCDREGVHWYGFYHGPRFYWTRYWADRWWWFDARFDRWTYWYDGYWWWPAPNGLVYVYVDNSYYPYEDGSVVVERPETTSPPQELPASSGEGTSVTSPDGKRMVQIFGGNSDAFLYDNTGGRPSFMRFLAGGVDRARFSGGANGRALRILLDFRDGSFALYDADGHPLDKPAATAGGANPGAIPAPPEGGPPPAPPGE